ncbi:D-glycero-alpha-D-manno-heptose-1,7-bisphosphate 7-phosphatase [cyanobacterium endosymbiont of Epithemia turgida]|uniref:D-glycero-alpha-D-manno-heptose-1,7-bisphosphate 7-phosphatase n=1 Tax=cyanobacterium endosymbiont of Epithemia turgida TaxID=718217 RepID=UPI0004D1BF0A|nr:HAD family hydrolase [cyanobacterium endosymbiont of Epithemia turgida]BAP17633.1 histidinol-phosphate phosphatase [cyanobacterium endosymbiont of Epithemia turgida isolate EtSB Lake Yunoko]
MVDYSTNTSHTHFNKALFLDRDGVIVNYVPYLSKPEQVKLPSGAGEALRQWQDAGYLLIIITNQAGVGRGYYSLQDVEKVHCYIQQQYSYFGVFFTDIFVCPHRPDDKCFCRKPSPEMLINASNKHHIVLSQSFFIGDAFSDLEAAIRANCKPILVLTGRGLETVKKLAQYPIQIKVFKELFETVKLIN